MISGAGPDQWPFWVLTAQVPADPQRHPSPSICDFKPRRHWMANWFGRPETFENLKIIPYQLKNHPIEIWDTSRNITIINRKSNAFSTSRKQPPEIMTFLGTEPEATSESGRVSTSSLSKRHPEVNDLCQDAATTATQAVAATSTRGHDPTLLHRWRSRAQFFQKIHFTAVVHGGLRIGHWLDDVWTWILDGKWVQNNFRPTNWGQGCQSKWILKRNKKLGRHFLSEWIFSIVFDWKKRNGTLFVAGLQSHMRHPLHHPHLGQCQQLTAWRGQILKPEMAKVILIVVIFNIVEHDLMNIELKERKLKKESINLQMFPNSSWAPNVPLSSRLPCAVIFNRPPPAPRLGDPAHKPHNLPGENHGGKNRSFILVGHMTFCINGLSFSYFIELT